MRGRVHAAAAATLFVAGGWLLALLMPLLSSMSGACIALVTLRHGALEGLRVAGIAAAMMAVVSMMLFGSMMPSAWVLVAVWLPALLCSWILDLSRQQGWMIAVAAGIAAAAAGAIRLATGDATQWWQQVLDRMFRLASEAGQTPQVSPEALKATAAMMNSLVAGSLLVTLVLTVLLARYWQAKLYNPGGFGEEFRSLQLPRLAVSAAMLVALPWLLISRRSGAGDAGVGYAGDVVAVVLCALLFHGVALVHHEHRRRQWPLAALVGFYAALLILPQYVMVLLVAIASADLMLDFRRLRAAEPD